MTTSFVHDTPELAAIYDRISDSQFEAGQRLVERLQIGPGARVLDVGCGTGRLARWIAERVGPTGAVFGIDPLPERVAIARSKGDTIRFDVGRAEELGAFEPASLDYVCMSAVFHWVEDKPKALREIGRVLRPGGLLGLTTLTRDFSTESTVARVLRATIAEKPYMPQLDFSKLAVASRGHTATELIGMIFESGLELYELGIKERRRVHATGAEAIDFLEASSFGNFLRIAPEELRPTLRKDLETAFEARKTEAGIVLRDWGTVLVASAPLQA